MGHPISEKGLLRQEPCRPLAKFAIRKDGRKANHELDGWLISEATVKIVDHGPDAARWNLVILGDGYRAAELTTYHDDVRNFLDRMFATAPYHELWCGINVHRIDVVSTESGADDPVDCPEPEGTVPTGRAANLL
jgi:hypothetical protein